MPRRVEVVAHDPAWATTFADEARRLRQVFGDTLIAIHHIGSTSVPGLAAKPIVDMLVVLSETDTINRFSTAMEALGYRVRGECLDAEIPGTAGRFYFSRNAREIRTHQVHACAAGHPEISDKLAFRDYLRTNLSVATEYGMLKQKLALRFRHDHISYMHGKDAFIKAALQDARYTSIRSTISSQPPS